MDFDSVGSYVMVDMGTGDARLVVQVGRRAVFGVSIKNGGSPRAFSHFSTPGANDKHKESEIWGYVFSQAKSASCWEWNDFEKHIDEISVLPDVMHNLLQCNEKMLKSWSRCLHIGNQSPIQDNHFTYDEEINVNSELHRIDEVIMRMYNEANQLGGGSAAVANAGSPFPWSLNANQSASSGSPRPLNGAQSVNPQQVSMEEEWKDVDISGMDNDVLDSIVGHGSTGEFEMHGRQWRFIENGGELVLQSRSCWASSRGGEGAVFSETCPDDKAARHVVRKSKTMALVLDNGGIARFEKGRLYECASSGDLYFNGVSYIGLLDADGIEGHVKNDRVKLVRVYVEPPVEAAKAV